MSAASYRTYEARRLSLDDDVLLEAVSVAGRTLLIATDMRLLTAPNVYHQEAYGFIGSYAPGEYEAVLEELRRRIYLRRAGVSK